MNSKNLTYALTNVMWACCLITGTIANSASAQSTDNKPPALQDGEHSPRREPPPQAYEDCKGKKESDIVQITTPREGKISATCTASAKGLFARPERPPHRNGEPQDIPPPKK
ncbi:hypothetical protein ACO0K0_14120 [Undibacterium sp. SXout11W]|uniref:hypothetical protein n=1 Tax=Undibacterium sp. SXout11W TaxID=3413050 RepID=UPI003BF0C312